MTATGKQPPISGKDQLLIAALIAGSTQAEAAKASGYSPRTVARRLEEPGFRAALELQRGQVFRQVLDRVAHHAARAADVLAEVMDDPETCATARVSASRALLDAALKYREVEDLARRVEALEGALSGGGVR